MTLFSLERWPLFPRPKQDELLSSWIARLALENGTKSHRILTSTGLLTSSRSLRTIDYLNEPTTLFVLAKRAGTTTKNLWNTTLTEYHQHLSVTHTKRMQHLLLLGLANAKHDRYYLQYCPQCLVENTYFRRAWRLSSVVACPTHGCALHDRCPQCNAPIYVFGQDEKSRANEHDENFDVCWRCGFDLKASPCEPVSQRLQAFCGKIINAVGDAKIEINESYWCYLGSYLLIIRQLAHALLNVQRRRYEGRVNDLDCLPLSLRLLLIEEIATALSNPPTSFVRFCKRKGINPYMLKTMERKNGLLHWWFNENCVWPMSKKYAVVTPAQVKSAVKLMKTKKLKVNCYSVNRFMGLNESPVIAAYFKHKKG